MAKIHNPQNQFGKDLATHEYVEDNINILRTKVDKSFGDGIISDNNYLTISAEEITDETGTYWKTTNTLNVHDDGNNILDADDNTLTNKVIGAKTVKKSIEESRLDVYNMDDVEVNKVVDSFNNLNKIKFAGKYVNVVSGAEDGEIVVYINEDNSLPTLTEKPEQSYKNEVEKRFIYGVPEGATFDEFLTGGKSYSQVAKRHDIEHLTYEYTAGAFSLSKSDYTFFLDYKINNVDKSVKMVLNELFKSDDRDSTKEINGTTIKDGHTIKFRRQNFGIRCCCSW